MSPAVITALTVRRLLISDGHRYFGRHGRDPLPHAMREVSSVECVAGRGLRGDRFFDYKDGYRGQVTLFAQEVFNGLCAAMSVPDADIAALRRNLVVSGADLNDLVGRTFELQGVRFEGVEECRPCYWMDQAIAPGAEAWLRGRGGLRCRVLSDGWLKTEPAGIPVK